MKTTKAHSYTQHILQGKLALNYGVDYDTFKALKTCGLPEESALVNGKRESPYLSTWLLRGEPLEALLAAGRAGQADCRGAHAEIGSRLCSNLVLLGLNAGAMAEMTPAWHFFHKRLHKTTGELVETPSEQYLKEYLTGLGLPFEGAYMTDILKFQDTENSLYIEQNSLAVTTEQEMECHNFKVLEQELGLLHANMPVGEKMLLVPLGGKSEAKLKRFLEWLRAEGREQAWMAVPPTFMPHYSSTGWNNPHSKAKAKLVQGWCKEHIIAGQA